MTKNNTNKRSVTNKERLIVLETKFDNLDEHNRKEHEEIKGTLGKIERKLDNAMDEKADKETVDKLDKRVWAIIMAVAVTFLGVMGALIQVFFG